MILIWPSNAVRYLLIIAVTSSLLDARLMVLMPMAGDTEGAINGIGWGILRRQDTKAFCSLTEEVGSIHVLLTFNCIFWLGLSREPQ